MDNYKHSQSFGAAKNMLLLRHVVRKLNLQFTRSPVIPRRMGTNQTVAASPRVSPWNARKILWRCLWVPAAGLSLIPVTNCAFAAYHYLRDERKKCMGHLLYARTGFLAIPLMYAVFGLAPYVYLTDWSERRLLLDIMLFWAKTTTEPFFKPIIVNRELLPADDQHPVVFVSNHHSFLDTYTLCWLDQPLRFVSKQAVVLIPVVGWVMPLLGHVLLVRKDKASGRSALSSCADKLRQGASITFFAEGTRSLDGSVGPFRIGAFKLAADEGVNIVPLTILHTSDLMPVGHEFELDVTNGPIDWGTKPGEENVGQQAAAGGQGAGSSSPVPVVVVHPAIPPCDPVTGRKRSPDELLAATRTVISNEVERRRRRGGGGE